MTKQRKTAKGAPRPAAPQPVAPIERKYALMAGLTLYFAVMAAMVAFDSYAFILKSTVVPFLLLAAVATRRFAGFVNDWAVFLGAIVLFDALRSLVFAVTAHFELPMYAGYAIAWERLLLGGAVAPVAVQKLRAALADPLWMDRLFVLLHASHFLFFLLFGFLLWLMRRDVFRTYAVAMIVLMYLALLMMLLVPTIPPWMAANDYLLLPPIERVISSVYNVKIPGLVSVFDVNPIAAMPSLHTAMPALCVLLAARYFGWVAAAVAAYALGVWFGIIYLGEHYLVDVLAGVLLALAVFGGVLRWGTAPKAAADASLPGPQRFAPQPLLLALVLAGVSFGIGRLASGWLAPVPVTKQFVERELSGRSKLAHYLLGRLAFSAGDFTQASEQLTLALQDLPSPEHQTVIRSFLGRSAQRSGDFGTAIVLLEPLRATTGDVNTLVALAIAYVNNRQFDKGGAVLREAQQRFPAAPEPEYWLARLQQLKGEADTAAAR